MVYRPAWAAADKHVIRKFFPLEWHGGFAASQKQKNIESLHNNIRQSMHCEPLEISTKGQVDLGKNLSAFIMKYNGIFVECHYQSSKKFVGGGPYRELLHGTPVEAKTDERLYNSGELITFNHEGIDWPIVPRSLFYDNLYLRALLQTHGKEYDLSDYDWFTDIEYNPNRGFNCQARTVAIYKLLQETGEWDVLNDVETWKEFHEYNVLG